MRLFPATDAYEVKNMQFRCAVKENSKEIMTGGPMSVEESRWKAVSS